jgi:hypothetical protein
MRLPGLRRRSSGGESVACGCCGQDRQRTAVHELGSTAGVFVCWRCALWMVARTMRRKDRAP